MDPTARSFPLAPMSRGMAAITGFLLLLPPGFAAAWALGARPLGPAAIAVTALYVAVWFTARPTRFELTPTVLRVVFPLWVREIPAADLADARVVPLPDLRADLMPAIRIGVGGLWGVFGWLWSRRRGLVETYVSRESDLVLVERRKGRTLLLTPVDAEGFADAIRRASGAA